MRYPWFGHLYILLIKIILSDICYKVLLVGFSSSWLPWRKVLHWNSPYMVAQLWRSFFGEYILTRLQIFCWSTAVSGPSCKYHSPSAHQKHGGLSIPSWKGYLWGHCWNNMFSDFRTPGFSWGSAYYYNILFKLYFIITTFHCNNDQWNLMIFINHRMESGLPEGFTIK